MSESKQKAQETVDFGECLTEKSKTFDNRLMKFLLLLIIMALSIAISDAQVRFDSTIYPTVTIDDYANRPFIKLEDWQYFEAPSDSFLLQANNRSKRDAKLAVRDCFYEGAQDWLYDGLIIIPASPNGFKKDSGASAGWHGAFYDDSLVGDVISIQAKTTSIQLSAGISMQDNNPTNPDYFDSKVAHAIIFGQNGQLSIREAGQIPKGTTTFTYEVGDIGMIELINNLVVRYYLIKTDGTMILLRTTRSKLTVAPTVDVMLYQPDSELVDLLICASSNEVSTTFENIGVADFQKDQRIWQKYDNPRTRSTNAEPLQLADGRVAYTHLSSKKVYRSINLTPKTYNQAGFDYMEDFFNWHGEEKEFIFVDRARKDLNGNPQEFWARMSPITDATKNRCVFEGTVQVIETSRRDFVPKRVDETAPTCALATNSGSGSIARFVATATDNQEVAFVRFYIDGRHIFNLDVTSETSSYEIAFGTTGIAPGDYSIWAIAYDVAGNTGQSETRTLTIA
jgi:hypothetical protein